MADPKKDDPKTALMSTTYGIGQLADGKIESFPASELPARLAAQASQDEATTYAIENSDEDPTDTSDLDDLEAPAD